MNSMTLTDALATYGAILSTIGVLWNVVLYLKDSPKIVLSVMLGRFMPCEGRTLQTWVVARNRSEATHFIVTIANHGRRPVFVTKWFIKLEGDKGFLMVGPHYLPKTLSENDYVIEFTEELEFMTKPIAQVAVMDSTGKQWKLGRNQLKALNAEAASFDFRK